MKKTLLLSAALLAVCPAYAQTQPQLLFNHSKLDMTYPDVAGDYLVYSQRLRKNHQIMQVQRSQLDGSAQHIDAVSDNEMIRNGNALANGDIAFVSNRLGVIAPWLGSSSKQVAIHTGVFQSILMPNHLDVSSDGQTWVFDSTLDAARTPRIGKQFADAKLKHELQGQAWRMYHERLWLTKSGYPETQSGLQNTFEQPYIFTFQHGSYDVSMLSDGFDASLSQDGNSMVFVREDKGNFDLWLQNMDGTGLKRLTTNTYADVEPSLSPDGKRVIFVSNRDSRGDILQTFIHVLNMATGEVKAVTSGLGVIDGGPAWLDNNTIIFHSNRDPKAPNTDTVDNWRLWTVALPK